MRRKGSTTFEFQVKFQSNLGLLMFTFTASRIFMFSDVLLIGEEQNPGLYCYTTEDIAAKPSYRFWPLIPVVGVLEWRYSWLLYQR